MASVGGLYVFVVLKTRNESCWVFTLPGCIKRLFTFHNYYYVLLFLDDLLMYLFMVFGFMHCGKSLHLI